ncbi:hypothetical protein [uncultured Jatrophihabitans sp.]|uniref:hypothetical protein n=1 Tax=uncultured Jatrophihabitans sp. TaxID=1610747 RepID=UPI0035CBDC1C
MDLSRRITRTATSLFLAAVALVWLSTSGTLGGFTKAYLNNTNSSARTAKLAITNSAGGSGCTATASGATVPTACTDSLYPASATTAGAAGPTNSITNSGTAPAAAMVSSYKVAGCGVVYGANTVSAGANGIMFPRNGAAFVAGSGKFASNGLLLDGSTGYAASATASTEPTNSGSFTTKNYGLGIWFKTTSTSASPLFSFSASPLVDTTMTSDRTLYLDAAGKIGFVPESGKTTTPGLGSGVSRYNDGAWHFAYVAIAASIVSYSITVSVDGKSASTGSANYPAALDSYSGYWHLGWAPKAPAAGYFAGSLAGFVVDDDGSAPTGVVATPTTYSFDSAPTEQWNLSDSGGSFDGATVSGVYTASYPSGTTNPCATVNISWTMANPPATVFPGSPTLASLPSSGSIADPEPNTSQSSTITLSHASTISPNLAGLIIYAPIVATYTTGSWQVSFMWNAPTAGSTFVIR